MKSDIPDSVLGAIKEFAVKHGVCKIILFGSRARGTNTARSDIDLAVSGGDFDGFYHDIHENADTLLMFDIVQLERISPELKFEIDRDGILLYEKA